MLYCKYAKKSIKAAKIHLMKSYQRFIQVTLPLMTIFLPFYISIGRVLFFHIGGWMIFISFIFLAPALFFLMLGSQIIKPRQFLDHGKEIVSPRLAILYSILYLFVVFFNYFLVDFDDIGNSMSVASSQFGGLSVDQSYFLSKIFFFLCCFMFVLIYAQAIFERIKASKASAVQKSQRNKATVTR